MLGNHKNITPITVILLSSELENLKNTSLAAPGALAHRLQRRTACNAAPRASGPQNGRRGLERGPILGYWALPATFAK